MSDELIPRTERKSAAPEEDKRWLSHVLRAVDACSQEGVTAERYLQRAIGYIMIDNIDPALNHLDKSLRLSSKCARSYMARTTAAETPNHEKSTDQAIVLFYLGNAFYKRGRHRDAITAYDKAIGLQPNFDEAKKNRNVVLQR